MAVVISGGTKGIGLAIAKRLAGPGVGIVLGFREDEAAAREARAALSDVGARVEVVRADVGDVAGARALVEAGAALGGGRCTSSTARPRFTPLRCSQRTSTRSSAPSK